MLDTVKVMPQSEEQGDFILINKDDFDEKVHKLYVETKETKSKKDKSEQE